MVVRKITNLSQSLFGKFIIVNLVFLKHEKFYVSFLFLERKLFRALKFSLSYLSNNNIENSLNTKINEILIIFYNFLHIFLYLYL